MFFPDGFLKRGLVPRPAAPALGCQDPAADLFEPRVVSARPRTSACRALMWQRGAIAERGKIRAACPSLPFPFPETSCLCASGIRPGTTACSPTLNVLQGFAQNQGESTRRGY
ncbi:hypothetical protein SKAU_G00161910 [Synaphobranchus kaupii]|uniref:Uncharacterized protein n=1 Tax=Synaphobranchus kaupii TaxID=118154 RepID=A0A9Q1FIT9_SYNKA|nr:hypothetical protein SKAU_G00161910 [Synaphobranchus kaupii]